MTKFEVGKKYTHKSCSTEFYCEAIIHSIPIVSWNQAGGRGVSSVFAGSFDMYDEVKPLTFADLKPGEKFKWVVRRDSGDVVCMKLGGPMGKSLWIAIPTGFCFRDDANNEVVRVP